MLILPRVCSEVERKHVGSCIGGPRTLAAFPMPHVMYILEILVNLATSEQL